MQLKYKMYCNATGYSVAAQEYLLAIMQVKPELDIKTKFYNVALTNGVSPDRHKLFTSLSKKPDSQPQLMFSHSIPTLYEHLTGCTNMGFAIFETINPPRRWIDNMNKMKKIIVACNFNKHNFTTCGCTTPIGVVPHCFDTKMFNKHVLPQGRYNKYTFLSMGTWKKRKNWELLIKGFYDAFDQKDDVCLLTKTDKPVELQKAIVQIKQNGEWRTKNTAPIFIDNGVNCHFEQIPHFMKKADCFVSVSRGEGLGLCGLHAMALNIPTLLPRYGGILEYAKPEHCTFIEPTEFKREQSMDGIAQFSNCMWPVFSASSLRDKLRYMRYDKSPYEKAKLAYDYVHNNFNYDVIGNKMIKELELC